MNAMDRDIIQNILDNSSKEFFEKFFGPLLDEINLDEEPYDNKAYQLLAVALKSD